MYELEFKGSFHDIGQQYGQILKQAGLVPEEVTDQNVIRLEFANQCEIHIKKHCPTLIDYMKGIAEGIGYEYDRMKILPMILMYGVVPKPDCTIGYVSSTYTKSGHPILFRNYDWDYTTEKYFSLLKYHPISGYRFALCTDIWTGGYGGINEKGLLIGITAAAAYGGSWEPGISMNILVHWMLNQFSTTQEAADFLEKIPHAGSFHFFVVDQSKDIARVIATPKKVVVEHFHDVNTIQTNHIIVDSMLHLENPDLIPVSSPIRFQNIERFLDKNKGSIDQTIVKTFCRTHHSKEGIHEDDEYNGIKFGTIWSWYYDFATHEFFVSTGNPINNKYKKIVI